MQLPFRVLNLSNHPSNEFYTLHAEFKWQPRSADVFSGSVQVKKVRIDDHRSQSFYRNFYLLISSWLVERLHRAQGHWNTNVNLSLGSDRVQRRRNIDSHYVSRWFTWVLHVWYRLYVPMQMGRELLRVPFSEIMLRFLNSRLKQIDRITRAYRPLIYHRFSQIIFTILNAFRVLFS